jgi:hypothetical protein
MSESLDYLTTEIGKNFAANASIDQLLKLNPNLYAAVGILVQACQTNDLTTPLYHWDQSRLHSTIKE